MNRSWCKTPALGVAVQQAHIKKCYPGSPVACRNGLLSWEGIVSARESSGKYRLRMTYRAGTRPKIRVVEPNLREIALDRKIPHLFSQADQTLCLHFTGVWKPNLILAKTIIPWAVLWTEYFEWWVFTDEWAGEEIHHTGAK